MFPAPFVVKDMTKRRAGGAATQGLIVLPMSSLDAGRTDRTLGEMARITDRFMAGFDLTLDARHVVGQKLGETLVIVDGDHVLGFAVCHFGAGSEAFADDQLLIKHVYVSESAPNPSAVFGQLLRHVETIAVESGLRTVGLMVSAGRRSMLRFLFDRDYVATEVHQHWAGRCPMPGEPVRSVGSDVASIQPTQFGASELR